MGYSDAHGRVDRLFYRVPGMQAVCSVFAILASMGFVHDAGGQEHLDIGNNPIKAPSALLHGMERILYYNKPFKGRLQTIHPAKEGLWTLHISGSSQRAMDAVHCPFSNMYPFNCVSSAWSFKISNRYNMTISLYQQNSRQTPQTYHYRPSECPNPQACLLSYLS